MRQWVRKARRVVPHLARVGDLRTQRGGVAVQLAVGEGVRAVEHGGGLRPARGPVGARFLVPAVDAAHGQHHYGGAQAHCLARGFVHHHGARDPSAFLVERRGAVAVQQREHATFARAAQRRDQAARELARGAPDDVVARQAVAVAVQAALHPVHGGHELHALLHQPVVHLGARVLHVVVRPRAGPMVLGPEFAKAQPVGQRALGRVGDLHLRLQRRAH